MKPPEGLELACGQAEGIFANDFFFMLKNYFFMPCSAQHRTYE
jgi:hypothetical protein